MAAKQLVWPFVRFGRLRTLGLAAIVGSLLVHSSALAAISWDATGDSPWWFDPENWSESEAMRLPPTSDADNDPETADISVTDAQINIGSGAWDQGEGVVYDPVNDPFFEAAEDLLYPVNYGPQTIEDLYMSRSSPETNRLTIHSGNLLVRDDVHVGRSSGTAGVETQAIIVQTGGTVTINSDLDLGTTDTSNPGYGSGTYDYRGGTLLSDPGANTRVRLSAGGSAGTGGHGRIIMHNPDSGGYVRMRTLLVAAHGGQGGLNPDGVNTGVGILEFRLQNGGTRPIQVVEDLVLANGEDSDGMGVRSSLLELVLDEAPALDGGVPQNLGLVDVDFGNFGFGLITAPGGSPGSLGITLSGVADPNDPLQQDDIVSATFGSTQYNWTISYTGNITWTDANNSDVDMVSGTGGVDLVLVGHSSEALPGIPGDYNDDGTVDAADYVLWRKYEGTAATLPNDPNGGTIDVDQYNTWQSNFGAMLTGAGSGMGVANAPEPGAMFLVLAGLIGATLLRRRP
jgi:hypothetical protein